MLLILRPRIPSCSLKCDLADARSSATDQPGGSGHLDENRLAEVLIDLNRAELPTVIGDHAGTVRVTLSDEVGFEFDASSFSGSIDAQLPITGGGRKSRRSVRGTVGDGSARLEVSSFSGDIIIGQR